MPFPAGCGRSSLSTSISFHCSRGTSSLAQPTLHPDSTFHHLQEPQDPGNLHAPCHGVPTESLGCPPFHCNLSVPFSASLPSLLSISCLFPLFPTAISSIWLSVPRLSFKAGESQECLKILSQALLQDVGLARYITHTHTNTGPSWLLMALLHPWNRAAGKAQLWELCFHKVMEEIKETQLELSRADEKKNKRN